MRPGTSADAPVVTTPHVHVHEAELAALERDPLVLTAEERRWGRRRVTTRAGRTLALALPTGSQLTPGDILYVGPGWYVPIEAAPEPVLAVAPRSREESLRVAFEVGNRHFTLALDGERLLVPDDPAMDQLLTRLGVAYERTVARFVPLGAGHRHAHETVQGHAHEP
jgi:urease accessory protein